MYKLKHSRFSMFFPAKKFVHGRKANLGFSLFAVYLKWSESCSVMPYSYLKIQSISISFVWDERLKLRFISFLSHFQVTYMLFISFIGTKVSNVVIFSVATETCLEAKAY